MAKESTGSRQGSLLMPTSSWIAPIEPPGMLKNVAVLALDTETKDPDLKIKGPSWFRGGGQMVGFSLAWPGANQGFYVPLRHEGGDNVPNGAGWLAWLRDLLKDFTGTLVLANGFYDLGWLRTENIHINPNVTIWDVQMAEALLDEHRQRYNLNSLAHTYGLEPKDEALLNDAAQAYGVDAKHGLYLLPGRFVGPYAERDPKVTLDIYERQVPKVAAQKLERVLKLEHDLVPLLMEMRWRGVRVDTKRAERQRDEFMTESEVFRQQIKTLTGYLPDIWSADSCAVAMDKVSIRYNRTPKGAPSFTDDWLSDFEQGTVPWLINSARKTYKAAQTFCQGMILDHADAAGRIHCEFHPLRGDEGGTVGGRFSCSNPNLQQVPSRDKKMNALIRGLFLPEEGEMYCASDYSQQEPRLTVHYAAERGCTRAEEVVARYHADPSLSYHNIVAEWIFGTGFNKDQYARAKIINLGLAYGMGGAKLCRSLGMPTKTITGRNGREYDVAGEEGQALLDKYHKEVPFIRELQEHYGEVINQSGEIRTLSGRLCRFPFFEPSSGGRALPYRDACATYGPQNIRRAFTHKALNRKIQGGSADMVKVAMRNLWREGLVPLITIHDEIDISVPDKETAKKVAEIMTNCVKLRVPLKVDVDLGPTWGEAKPLKDDD